MASTFHGEFEVTQGIIDSIDGNAYGGVNPSWLLVCRLRGFDAPRLLVVASDHFSRDEALCTLRWYLHNDLRMGLDYDYELWHCVDEPDWMSGHVPPAFYEDFCGERVAFGTIDDVKDYVRAAVGSCVDDFDVEGIARHIVRWSDGCYYLLDVDFWAVVERHEIAIALAQLRDAANLTQI